MFILLYLCLGQYGAPTFLWILLYSARGLFLIKEIILESIDNLCRLFVLHPMLLVLSFGMYYVIFLNYPCLMTYPLNFWG